MKFMIQFEKTQLLRCLVTADSIEAAKDSFVESNPANKVCEIKSCALIDISEFDRRHPDALCLKFEYDERYEGGDYSDVGDFSYVPLLLVEQYGEEIAFEVVTGMEGRHIIHMEQEVFYSRQGDPT